jgi:mono/diheme cytochrome c family protein
MHRIAVKHRQSSRPTRWMWLCLLTFAAILGRLAVAQDLSSYTGPELYKRFCASCHGPTARGDGPVAATLKVEVPDLTLLVRHEGLPFPEEEVRRIIDGREVHSAHGSRHMPVWGYEFSNAGANESESKGAPTAALINRLIGYLRSIQRYSVPAGDADTSSQSVPKLPRSQ